MPLAVMSFDTEAILSMLRGDISSPASSSANPYPLAYTRESLRIIAREAPFISHFLRYCDTILSIPSRSGMSDNMFVRVSFSLSTAGTGAGPDDSSCLLPDVAIITVAAHPDITRHDNIHFFIPILRLSYISGFAGEVYYIFCRAFDSED